MSLMSEWTQPVEVFLAYAPEDENLYKEFEKHLTILQRQGLITSWHEHSIIAGMIKEQEIHRHLTNARLILLLISSNFLASNFYHNVMVQALKRHSVGESHVIPILLRPASWEETPLGELQVLPRNETPILKWRSRDEVWLHVTQELRVVIANLTKNKGEGEHSYSSRSPIPAIITQAPFLIDSAVPEGQGLNALLGRDNLLKQLRQRLLEGGNLALTAHCLT